MTEQSAWSDTHIKMLNTVDVFIHKPAIISKTEKAFQSLKSHLATHIETRDWVFPEGVDLVKGQVVKGENHKGFPFVSLDLPQYFTKDTFFTFRVLFWWGHYLGFSLILKGDPVQTALPSIIRRARESEFADIQFAISENPWEWELKDENFQPVHLLDQQQIQSQADTKGYFKLLQTVKMSDASFPSLDWNSMGKASLDRMMTLTSK